MDRSYSIRVKNFKSLSDSGYVDIKPLTLLFGPNNSGKSSFLQLLYILKESSENNDNASPLLLNNRFVKLGTFEDIVFRHETKRTIEVNIKHRIDDEIFIITIIMGLANSSLELIEYVFEYKSYKLNIDDKQAIFKINQEFYKLKSDNFEKEKFFFRIPPNFQNDRNIFELQNINLHEIEKQIKFWEESLDNQFPINQVKARLHNLEAQKETIIRDLTKIKERYNLEIIR